MLLLLIHHPVLSLKLKDDPQIPLTGGDQFIAPTLQELLVSEARRRGWGDPWQTACNCSLDLQGLGLFDQNPAPQIALTQLDQTKTFLRFHRRGKTTDDLVTDFERLYFLS